VSNQSKTGRWTKYRCDGKCLTVLGFVFSILVVGAGGFFLGVVFAHPLGASGPERATAVIEEAKRRIPAPNPPPQPAGHTVTENKVVTVNIPRMSGFGFGGFATQQVTVPTTKLVGATPEETAKWQAEANKLQSDYEKRLTDEAKKIANDMFVNDWRSTVTLLTTFSKEVVIPFLAGLAGIIGAIVALMKAFRTKPDAAT
jgi:hypothetical protein